MGYFGVPMVILLPLLIYMGGWALTQTSMSITKTTQIADELSLLFTSAFCTSQLYRLTELLQCNTQEWTGVSASEVYFLLQG